MIGKPFLIIGHNIITYIKTKKINGLKVLMEAQLYVQDWPNAYLWHKFSDTLCTKFIDEEPTMRWHIYEKHVQLIWLIYMQ